MNKNFSLLNQKFLILWISSDIYYLFQFSEEQMNQEKLHGDFQTLSQKIEQSTKTLLIGSDDEKNQFYGWLQKENKDVFFKVIGVEEAERFNIETIALFATKYFLKPLN